MFTNTGYYIDSKAKEWDEVIVAFVEHGFYSSLIRTNNDTQTNSNATTLQFPLQLGSVEQKVTQLIKISCMYVCIFS
jgi:hypothetical protein